MQLRAWPCLRETIESAEGKLPPPHPLQTVWDYANNPPKAHRRTGADSFLWAHFRTTTHLHEHNSFWGLSAWFWLDLSFLPPLPASLVAWIRREGTGTAKRLASPSCLIQNQHTGPVLALLAERSNLMEGLHQVCPCGSSHSPGLSARTKNYQLAKGGEKCMEGREGGQWSH